MSLRRAAYLGSMLLAGATAACDGSAGGTPGFGDVSAAAPPAGSREIDARFVSLSAAAEPGTPATYQIGPSDVLGISVFQVPELNTDAQVAANGTIALPLIGTVRVGGREAPEVAGDIAARLRAKYLQAPQVTVFVKTYNSQKVVVSGAVTAPGTLAMTGDTTLLSAIADARGLSELADGKNVLVFRKADGRKTVARFDVNDIQLGRAPDPHLHKGDVVFVDTNDVKSWVKTLLPIVAVAGVFAAFI